MKDYLYKLLGLMILVILLAGCGSGSNTTTEAVQNAENNVTDADGAIKIRLAHITKPGHPWEYGAQKLGEILNKKTDGSIVVETFHSGQLGNESDMLQQLSQGSIEMAVITAAELSQHSDAFGSWLMPFIVNTHEQAYDLWMSEESMSLFEELDGFNVQGLGYFSSGFRNYLMTNDGVTTPEDLANKSLRITPSPAKVDYYRLLSVSPTPMPLTEVYTALQQGVIDGVDIDSVSIIPERLYEVAGEMTPSNHIYWLGGILINRDFYNSLSEEQQTILSEAVQAAMEANVSYTIEEESKIVDEIGDQITLYELDREAFQPYVLKLQESWKTKHEKIEAFLNKAKEIRGE